MNILCKRRMRNAALAGVGSLFLSAAATGVAAADPTDAVGTMNVEPGGVVWWAPAKNNYAFLGLRVNGPDGEVVCEETFEAGVDPFCETDGIPGTYTYDLYMAPRGTLRSANARAIHGGPSDANGRPLGAAPQAAPQRGPVQSGHFTIDAMGALANAGLTEE
jgi:hypothetical protein